MGWLNKCKSCGSTIANTAISMTPAIKNDGHKINIQYLVVMAEHSDALAWAWRHGYAFLKQAPIAVLFVPPMFY
jgi:hypothetical protein